MLVGDLRSLMQQPDDLAAVAVLLVGCARATTSSRNGFKTDDVVDAFARQGFDLVEPGSLAGATGLIAYRAYALLEGAVLFPRPRERPDYAFIASREAVAKRYFEAFPRLERTPGSFDLHRDNVFVSCHSSFTENGLSREKRALIHAAMDALGRKHLVRGVTLGMWDAFGRLSASPERRL